MKKVIILSLLALTSIAIQAQKSTSIRVRTISPVFMRPSPNTVTDNKTKQTMLEWPNTENNTWHENIGILDNVPSIKAEDIYPDLSVTDMTGYVPIRWKLTDEGDNTVLHCYLLMKADVVTNLWLGNAESVILDKETGTIYQAKSTVPECCYDKVFGVKGKKGNVLDLKINFPRLPETAKDLAIYGVPNWLMRGFDVKQNNLWMPDKEAMPAYDPVPQFHIAHMVKDSVHYDKDNYGSWAVYNDPHLIKPVKEKTMALWRTPDATYLAIATEQNWIREYYGRGGDCILLSQQGRQFKCKGVIGYPNNRTFWLEGYPGDYFAIVLIFEPLPLEVKSFTYVAPEGEPFNMWGANWDGEVIPNLEVQQLRKNQKLFEYHPRVVVK